MSRVGKQPINIPDGVTVHIDGNVMTARSSKGELHVPFSEKMEVTCDSSMILVKPGVQERDINAIWGLTRSLIYNAVKGVHSEWGKVLEIYGIGYRAQLKGKDLDLQIGQSHPIVITPPEGIVFEAVQESIDGQNVQVITVKGISKQQVGDIAAKIRALKPPEPYKGKGIRYRGEYVRRKAGKATG